MDAASQLKGDPSWYAVGSKTIRRVDPGEGGALIAHLGYGDGIFREDLFGGAEFFFSPATSALVEYHGGKMNLGVRGQLGGLSGTIGFFDTKHLGAGLRFNVPFR
jgi:hypothetical protein